MGGWVLSPPPGVIRCPKHPKRVAIDVSKRITNCSGQLRSKSSLWRGQTSFFPPLTSDRPLGPGVGVGDIDTMSPRGVQRCYKRRKTCLVGISSCVVNVPVQFRSKTGHWGSQTDFGIPSQTPPTGDEKITFLPLKFVQFVCGAQRHRI